MRPWHGRLAHAGMTTVAWASRPCRDDYRGMGVSPMLSHANASRADVPPRTGGTPVPRVKHRILFFSFRFFRVFRG